MYNINLAKPKNPARGNNNNVYFTLFPKNLILKYVWIDIYFNAYKSRVTLKKVKYVYLNKEN
jgi:hypothetical protein